MIVLSQSTDKLQIKLAATVAANQCQCFASYDDVYSVAVLNAASATFATPVNRPGRSAVSTNNTSDVDFVGAPDASYQREINFLSIYNADTAAAIVTLKLDANGTEYILLIKSIPAGETLFYTQDQGFFFAGSPTNANGINTDSALGDAFSRLRVSNPESVFDAQLTYDLQPLLFEQITAETGASIAHSATNRLATMTFSSTPTGGIARMQSYEHFRYQPGKSQLVFVTFNMQGGVANVVKSAGYSDGSNGIEFLLSGTTSQVRILSDSGNGDQTVSQADWNLDKLNGSGASGKTLALDKTQIFVIDFQALYVGRVRVGFDIDGSITYVHEFNHANLIATPYIQTANLPIRVGMTCTGTVSTTMDFICCSIISEGGQEFTTGYSFETDASVTAGSGTRTHMVSLRPKTTFNSITNRTKLVLDTIDILITGNQPILWELCVGQALTTPSFADVNATYSATQVDTAGTLSGDPAIVIASGFTSATASAKTSVSRQIINRYPITLNAAGAVRDLGTLTLLVTGIGGTSACRAAINWREIR